MNIKHVKFYSKVYKTIIYNFLFRLIVIQCEYLSNFGEFIK